MTTTSFIGRTDELARLARAFEGGARLVTVLGPPGIGKTRLAQRYAEGRGDARFVDLTEARDGDDLAAAAGADRDGDQLLVLDNFEQLAEHAPVLLDWLAAAPALRLLVTSRERLRVDGEHAIALAPLGRDDAVRLFEDRAQGYVPRPGDRAHILRIAERLEGIPLAIELAASRAGVLSPAQLAERLDRQFEVLAGGPRGATARHATLRSAIDWSWSLLEPAEQSALAQCSVFRGGFPLDAAEAIVDLSAVAKAPPLLDVLQSLTEKSLVRSSRLPDTGEVRFALFEAIREYAGERLAERGERGPAVFRHSAHYARMSRAIGARVVAPSGLSFVGQLEVELDNLIYALASMLDDEGALGRAATMAWKNTLALQDVVAGRGKLGVFDVLRHAATDLQAAARAGQPAPLRAEIWRIIGVYYGVFGRPDDARAYFGRAIAASDAGDRTRAGALYGLGTFELAVGRLDDGRRALDEALAIAERDGDGALCARVLAQYGNLALRRGDADEAASRFDRAQALARDAGDRGAEALLLGNLGIAHQERGRFDDARDCFERAAAIHRERGDDQRLAGAIAYRAAVAHERGELDAAAADYDEAIALARRAGARRCEVLFSCWAGSADAARGRPDAARARFEAAEGKARDLGDGGLFTTLALHRASVALADGDRPRARAAVDAAEAWLADAASRARSYSAPDQADDLRFGVRLLGRALSAGAFALARDGSWFAPPGGERVDLSGRPRLRRLVAALVDHYCDAPGAALSLAELIERGWPGERMDAESAINRVHVALTTLRKLGLRELLVRDDAGYAIDPGAAMVVDG